MINVGMASTKECNVLREFCATVHNMVDRILPVSC